VGVALLEVQEKKPGERMSSAILIKVDALDGLEKARKLGLSSFQLVHGSSGIHVRGGCDRKKDEMGGY